MLRRSTSRWHPTYPPRRPAMRSPHPTTTRRTAGAAAVALIFGALALATANPALAASGTYVRQAQLTQKMAGWQVVLSSVGNPRDTVTIPGAAYGATSGYQLVQPGEYVL